LAWFAHERVDVAVVEVGLGGRLDATNILDAEASAIVSIGFDHMDILGDTLPAIAREKAGIAKPGRPLVVGALPDEARRAVEAAAKEAGAHVIHAPDIVLPDDVVLDLPGKHQRANARVALGLLQALDPAVLNPDSWDDSRAGEAVVRHAFASVRALSGLRARLETLSSRPRIVVDIGHNPEAIGTALAGLAEGPDGAGGPDGARGPDEDGAVAGYTVVIGMLGDKDAGGVGRVLAAFARPADDGRAPDGTGLVHAVWTVPTHGSRGRSAEALAAELASGMSAEAAAGARVKPDVEILPSVEAALRRARAEGRNALFIGSHEVAAAAVEAIEGPADR
jgi:folylpolyglutamate synthase/dihydrofolate synthase